MAGGRNKWVIRSKQASFVRTWGSYARRSRLERLEDRSLLAGAPELLAALNQTATHGSNPAGPAALLDGVAYFAADDGIHGVELWRTDGTAAGTYMVADIAAGSANSSPAWLTTVADTLYFSASDHLWKTDGTAGGTELVSSAIFAPAELVDVSGSLYFRAFDSANGSELWRSDGTSSGTVLAADINPGTSSSTPTNLVNAGGRRFFVANDGLTGNELWTSDGTSTSTGTAIVRDLTAGSGSSSLDKLTALGSRLFFVWNDGLHGTELWSSDGTSSGTAMVADLRPGTANSSPSNLTNYDGTLYFRATDATGQAIFTSDAAASGVNLFYRAPSPSDLSVVGDRLYFSASNASGGMLYRTDGTPTGTELVFSTGDTANRPRLIRDVNGRPFFFSSDMTQLWTSDGTSAGTVLLKQFDNTAQPLSALPSGLLFLADDGAHGYEPWISDGASGGAALLRDINMNSAGAASNPEEFTAVDGYTFFTATDASTGGELYVTDATSAGTGLIADIRPGQRGSYPNSLTAYGGKVYFVANDGVGGQRLWGSNETGAASVISSQNVETTLRPAIYNDKLYYGDATANFIQYDGTSNVLLRSLPSGPILGPNPQSPTNFTVAQGKLFYVQPYISRQIGGIAWISKIEVVRSDGTQAGTQVVATFNYTSQQAGGSLSLYSIGDRLVAIKDKEGVFAYNGASLSSVFAFDGPSTVPLGMIGSQLILSASRSPYGQELWMTDGTSAGTILLRDIVPGAEDSMSPTTDNGLQIGATIYFTAAGLDGGTELWKTDGTSGGTVLVRDIRAGSGSSDPRSFAALGNHLFFAADDGVHGRELWTSDGTSSGTRLVGDIYPGSASSEPQYLTNSNGTLYFSADDDVYGRQPWVIRNSIPIANAGGVYAVNEGDSLQLDASASNDTDGDRLSYSWDLNGDGVFGDATGASPTLSWSQIAVLGIGNGPSSRQLRVRVDDGFGGVADSAPVTLSINNAPPAAALIGPAAALRDSSQTFTLSADDPSPADQAAGFTFAIDWGDGSPIETMTGPSGATVSHAFARIGPRTVSVTATDQDGGTSDAATLIVNVTSARLVPNTLNPLLNDLVWAGTDGVDHVQFEQVDATTVRVRTLLENGASVNSEELIAGVTGRVIAAGQADNDTLDAAALATIPATLDGGAGNNTLYGGQAGDVLIGGSNGGEGQQGNNTIIAGGGSNTIYGNAEHGYASSTGGNNLIVGGAGSDTIYGAYATVTKLDGTASNGAEGGQNLIVGGGGADTIYAAQQADGAEGGKGSLILAGTTTLDQTALAAVLSEWTSARGYAARIANISGTGSGSRNNGDSFLVPSATVFDDGAADAIYSDTNGQLNWLLYSLGQDIANRVKSGETATDTP